MLKNNSSKTFQVCMTDLSMATLAFVLVRANQRALHLQANGTKIWQNWKQG